MTWQLEQCDDEFLAEHECPSGWRLVFRDPDADPDSFWFDADGEPGFFVSAGTRDPSLTLFMQLLATHRAWERDHTREQVATLATKQANPCALPSEWPAGWSVGVDGDGYVMVLGEPEESQGPLSRVAAIIYLNGEEHSVWTNLEDIPAPVLSTARALHRSLGRPCPWDAQGGLTLEQAAIASGCTGESISIELDPRVNQPSLDKAAAVLDLPSLEPGPHVVACEMSASGDATWWIDGHRVVSALAPDQDQTTASDPDPPSATPETGADDPERGQDKNDCRECVHYRDGICCEDTEATVAVGSGWEIGLCPNFTPILARKPHGYICRNCGQLNDSDRTRCLGCDRELSGLGPIPGTTENREPDCPIRGRDYQRLCVDDPEPLDPDYVQIQRDEWTDMGRRLVMAEGRLLDLLELLRSEHSPVDSDAEDLQAAWDEEDDQAQETETKTETPPQRHPCRDCEAGPGTAKDAGARAEKETGTRTGCG